MLDWEKHGVKSWLHNTLTQRELSVAVHNESQVEQFEDGIGPFKKSELYHSFKILNGESQMKQNNFYLSSKRS